MRVECNNQLPVQRRGVLNGLLRSLCSIFFVIQSAQSKQEAHNGNYRGHLKS
jgi:hypothetical protein